MREQTQRRWLGVVSLAAFFSMITSLFALFGALPTGAAEKDAVLLSPGLSVIAESCELVVSAEPGGEAVFSRADFERTVGGELDYITLTSRPSSAVGQLTIGSILLPEGQRITASNLDRLSFMPNANTDAESASFRFRADTGVHEYVCIIRLKREKSANSAPSLDCATAAALNLKAPLGGVCGGVLAAFDPDGDATVFEIVRYPRHGSVMMTDRARGSYVYKPTDGYTGKDSFVYTVRDEWGNYAGEARVSITVSRFLEDDFADMSGREETDARLVSAAGLMGGVTIGGERYFYPERTMTRSEFVSSLMMAAGYEYKEGEDNAAVFADCADIPTVARPYVSAAYREGIVSGWIVDGEQLFLPDEEITLAEAAVMVSRLLSLDTDIAAEVSAGAANWAREELAVLCFAGFRVSDAPQSVTASKRLTRAEAAGLLGGVLAVAEAGGIKG